MGPPIFLLWLEESQGRQISRGQRAADTAYFLLQATYTWKALHEARDPIERQQNSEAGLCPQGKLLPHICSGLPSLDATKCPSQDCCASPPLPDHCHWHERKASRLREPSEPQEDCSASPLQGNPSSWVYNTLCTIPSPARLTLASPVFHNPGQTIILCLEGVLSHRLEVFSLEWLLKMSQPNLVPGLSLKDLCLQ